ncbi:NUDIX domain-containing protein [Microbacterium sp. X-17]|uniref:NUDIX domain-containing protein n=1 Tax=Microbacterium sp. X-17 TaxID=3144404 RepID=UPI0031F4FB3F
MPIRSAGILLHRRAADGVEVLLGHLGGPFWARKDAGAWSIPKGEYDPDSERPQDAAIREFREELGVDPPALPFVELGEFAYSSGKRVTVFAVDGQDWAPSPFVFGTFDLEWPPRSGRVQAFPEVDRAEWMPLEAAHPRLPAGQRPALAALVARLAA